MSPTFCVICGHRTTLDQQWIADGRAKRRSRKNHHRCVGCAGTAIYGRGPGNRYIEPRYCTCTGDIRHDPNGMCLDCLRLVESMASA